MSATETVPIVDRDDTDDHGHMLWHIYPQPNPQLGDKALCGRPLRRTESRIMNDMDPDSCNVCTEIAVRMDYA